MWLGLDFGTQGARAVVVSENGCLLARSSHPLSSRRDGARHEQDPQHWWLATIACCCDVLAQVPARNLKGVGVDGTSGTILLVDRAGRALTPGVMYDDLRARDEAREVNEAGAAVWDSLGYRMQASWALPKLLWLLRKHGALPHGGLAHQADYINAQLAGRQVATDWTNALKTGYDLIHDSWPCDVLDPLGAPRAILPAVVEPGTPVGAVCREAAEATGIPEGTPILAGLTDGCASQIAAGALDEGSWNCVLGTTLVVKGVTREPIRDPAGMVYSHRLPEGKWFPGGASNAGAGVIAARFRTEQLGWLSAEVSLRPPTDVLAYPLVSRGERFPFSTPDAEGFVMGQPSDDIELYAALLQGAGFVARLCLDYVTMLGATVNDIALTGGATRSRYWCQLCADILGRTVRLPENAEPAFGMAVLAASHGRSLSDVAKQMVRIRATFEPRPARFARLSASYVRLVDELAKRGWLAPDIAEYARNSTTKTHAA